MEQRSVIKSVTGTALVIGLSVSVMSGGTSTVLINGNYYPMADYREYEGTQSFQANGVVQRQTHNIYVQGRTRNPDKMAGELFGKMRDATKEEKNGIDEYIKSISKSTGVNFFDLC